MTNHKKLKIAFFIPDLSGGGAERIVCTFLQHLNRNHFEPILILCNQKGVYLPSIPEDVPILSLKKLSRWSFPLLLFRFNKIIHKHQPDLIISFLWYSDVIQLLCKTKHSPLALCSFHSVPNSIAKDRFGWLKIKLLKSVYNKADSILAVSKSVADQINKNFLKGQKKSLVQFNPFEFDLLKQKASENVECWNTRTAQKIIFIGRLEIVKGPDHFLKALSHLPPKLNWHAKLLGEGSMKNQLVEMSTSLNIKDKIDFDGFFQNPYPFLKEADVLVLSSRFEAFPSVIVEACALGIPVVSFDCPCGPKDIINESNGILVPSEDTHALANAMMKLLNDENLATHFSKNGPNSVAHLDVSSATKMLENHCCAVYKQLKS